MSPLIFIALGGAVLAAAYGIQAAYTRRRREALQQFFGIERAF